MVEVERGTTGIKDVRSVFHVLDLLVFEEREDERALRHGSWCFQGKLLFLERWGLKMVYWRVDDLTNVL